MEIISDMRHTLKSVMLVALVCLVGSVLGGCYMPVRFDVEMEVTREGYYSIIFDGYLAKIPLYNDLRQKKLSHAEEKEKAETYRKDLARDSAMSKVAYVKQGIYSAHWEKDGDILVDKFITFIRRNENMMSLRYVKKDGEVFLAGATIGKEQKQQLADIGLDMIGEVRLITDAKVVGHNAAVVKDWPTRGPRFKMYIWPFNNIFAPPPNLMIKLH